MLKLLLRNRYKGGSEMLKNPSQQDLLDEITKEDIDRINNELDLLIQAREEGKIKGRRKAPTQK